MNAAEPPFDPDDEHSLGARAWAGIVELLRDLLSIFRQESPRLLGLIGHSLRVGDAKSLEQAAHTLRGSVGSFGATTTAAQLALSLEIAGRDGALWSRRLTRWSALSRGKLSRIEAGLAALAGERRGMRILIADDEPVSRRLLEATLARLGHEVVSVADGTAATAALLSPDGPRLAVLDWMMPGADGLAVCRAIRQRQAAYVYIILLTSHNRREDLVAGLDAEADDFLTEARSTSWSFAPGCDPVSA